MTVQLCQTLERSKKLKHVATFHNDDTGLRILSCLDVVAADAVFHKRCSDLYLFDHVRGKRRAEINIDLLDATQDNSEEEHNFAIFYRKLLSQVIGDSAVLDMITVTALYNRITKRSSTNIQVRQFSECEPSETVLLRYPIQMNKSVLVYSKLISRSPLVQRIVDMFDNITSASIATVGEDVNNEDKNLIYYAANKVRASILKD